MAERVNRPRFAGGLVAETGFSSRMPGLGLGDFRAMTPHGVSTVWALAQGRFVEQGRGLADSRRSEVEQPIYFPALRLGRYKMDAVTSPPWMFQHLK